jgi:hypothetical protein
LKKVNNEYLVPKLAELEFPCLVIHEDWEFDANSMALPVLASCLVATVIGSRYVYGDWDVAWNVGCFMVGLVTLVVTWARYCVSC